MEGNRNRLLSRNSRFLEFPACQLYDSECSLVHAVMEDRPFRQDALSAVSVTWLCRASHSQAWNCAVNCYPDKPSYCVFKVGAVCSLQFVQWCRLWLALSFELRIIMREFSQEGTSIWFKHSLYMYHSVNST